MGKENAGGKGLNRGREGASAPSRNGNGNGNRSANGNKPAPSHTKTMIIVVSLAIALAGGTAGFFAYSYLQAPHGTEPTGNSTAQNAEGNAVVNKASSSTETETSTTQGVGGSSNATASGSSSGSGTESSTVGTGPAGGSGNAIPGADGARAAASMAATVFSSNDSGNNRSFYAAISSSIPVEFRGGDNIAWSAWKSGGDMAFLNECVERTGTVYGETVLSEEGGYVVASTPVSYTKRYTQTQTAGEELGAEHIKATLVVKTDGNGKIVYMAEKR